MIAKRIWTLLTSKFNSPVSEYTNIISFFNQIPHRYLSMETCRFLPKQSSLTIYNSSILLVNLEGCVNTLRDECTDFLHSHGRDGINNTAQSRYLCYYNKVGGHRKEKSN